MLGLGLAVSHAPSMFRGLEYWPAIHRQLTAGVPQPPEIAQETPEVLQSYIARIDRGFEVLREQVEAFKPDVLLVVGDDQGEVFTEANMPHLLPVYLRRGAWFNQHRPHRRAGRGKSY